MDGKAKQPYHSGQVDVFMCVTLGEKDEPMVFIFHYMDLAWRKITPGCNEARDNEVIEQRKLY